MRRRRQLTAAVDFQALANYPGDLSAAHGGLPTFDLYRIGDSLNDLDNAASSAAGRTVATRWRR